MQRLRRYGWVAVKLAASVGLVWLAVRDVDLYAARDLLAGFAPLAIGGLVLALAGQTLAGVARWRVVLRHLGARLSAGRATLIFLLGAFFNQCLPSSIGGDGARAWQAHRAGLPLSLTSRSVLLDRMAGLVALLSLVAAGAPLFHAWGGDLRVVLVTLAVGGSGLLAVAALAWWTRGGRPRGDGRLSQVVRALGADLRALWRKPATALTVLAWALVFQLGQIAVAWVGAIGLGVDLGPVEALVLLPVVLLVTMVPISLAGWGVREVAMVTALGVVGIAPASAVVVSLLYGLTLLVFGLGGGAAWWASGGLSAGPQTNTLKESS